MDLSHISRDGFHTLAVLRMRTGSIFTGTQHVNIIQFYTYAIKLPDIQSKVISLSLFYVTCDTGKETASF